MIIKRGRYVRFIYKAFECKPIAKELKLYDIFGTDLVDNQYRGNTILCSYYMTE